MATNAATAIRRAIRAAVGSEFDKLSDRELLRQFADDNNQEAFAVLFRRHGEMVLGVCRRILTKVQDAEDACQAVFLVLARKAKSTRWQASIVNWLYATARKVAWNASVAARRRVKREGKAAVPEVVQPIDMMTGRELLVALDEEMARLSPAYRETLVLCYLEGLTRDEAALRLDIPSTTVKTRLERGRKKLGDALTRRGCALGGGLLTLAVTSRAGASSPRLLEAVLASANGSVPAAVATLVKGVAMNGLGSMKTFGALALICATVLSIGLGAGRLVATNPPSEKAAQTKADQNKPITRADDRPKLITGQVVDSAGKPIADAKLYGTWVDRTRLPAREEMDVTVVGTSDKDGRFKFEMTEAKTKLPSYVIAHAPGYGVDWIAYGEVDKFMADGGVTLRLPKDVPITGQILNTEGKPVPGVSVGIAEIYVPLDEKLDAYLADWLKNVREAMSSPRKRLYAPLDKITGGAKTDNDGKFTLHGAGAERDVKLLIKDGGIARSMPAVITRPGLDTKPYNEAAKTKENRDLALNHYLGIYPPNFTFVAEAGKDIEGVVTDEITGKPIPGCSLHILTTWGDSIHVRTDREGKYSIQGLYKHPAGYGLTAEGPEGMSYLSHSPHADDTDGFGVIRLDFKMVRGTIVSGRIIDKQTGKGVMGAIRFAPLVDNKYFGTKPEFNSYARDRTGRPTDDYGRFRVTTIPGKSVVLVQVTSSEKMGGEIINPYRSAVPDSEYKDRFTYDKYQDSWTIVAAAQAFEFIGINQAAKVIDVKEGEETKVELVVDRGMTGKLDVQDADGKPLSGAWVSGVTESWPIAYKLSDSKGTIYALSPDKPRKLVVYHADKQLGGVVEVRGDENAPVVVKLAPVGKVTGKLFDPDGNPLVGAIVSVNGASITASELYRFAQSAAKPVTTNKDGRFTLEGVVPGMEFSLGIRKDNDFYVGTPMFGVMKLKPGETHNVGERGVEIPR